MANSTQFPNPHQPRTATQALPEPTLTTYPNRASDYSGAPTSSDAGTIGNVSAKRDFPGSGAPNQPIEKPLPQPNGRLGVNGAPVPGRGGRNPHR